MSKMPVCCGIKRAILRSLEEKISSTDKEKTTRGDK